MTSGLTALTLIGSAALLGAQSQPPQNPQPNGLQTDWDIAVTIQEIGDHAARLLPALEQIDARAWVEKGASETYIDQVQSAKDQARAMLDEARALAKSPEKVSAGLQLLFRIGAVDTMLSSVGEAVRKYASPAEAQTLARLAAEGGAHRERFQSYLVSLAGAQERQLLVMDKEAQRCRAQITAPPPKPPAKTVKKK